MNTHNSKPPFQERCVFGRYLTGFLVYSSITPASTKRCSHSFAWLFNTPKSVATSASVLGVCIFPSNSRTLATVHRQVPGAIPQTAGSQRH